MNKIALWGLRVFNFHFIGNIFKFDPSFTALMIEFTSQSLNLFNVTTVNQDTSESPTDFAICSSQ